MVQKIVQKIVQSIFYPKKSRSYSIRCFFYSTRRTLISAWLKDAKKKNKTKQNRLDKSKNTSVRCKIEESNCYLCLKLCQGILKSIFQPCLFRNGNWTILTVLSRLKGKFPLPRGVWPVNVIQHFWRTMNSTLHRHFAF